MSQRLGIRTLNGSIVERPALDVTGNAYQWQYVSLVVLPGHKTRFYVVSAGVKVTEELQAELQAEAIAGEPASHGPTPTELLEAELPAEETPPTRTRRKNASDD